MGRLELGIDFLDRTQITRIIKENKWQIGLHKNW